MHIPEGLYFTDTHEWVKIEDDIGLVGITDFAQKELGDVVFVELPEEGDEVDAGEVFGEIESTKAVSDLKSPVTGIVLEVNDNEDDYSVINNEPYGDGWMLKIKLKDPTEISKLMNKSQYEELLS